MKRLGFVVQRYGLEIDGGAEYQCRRVAEALTSDYEVEVLTTCARDYLTWRNVYPPGVDTLNGVRVRRFPVSRPRRVRAFGRFADRLYARPHTPFEEFEWIRRQGPLAFGLLDWIKAREADYHGFVFFTYLYLPTLLGLPLVSWKAILVPTAHDEPPIALDVFRPLFHLPRGIIYNAEEERAFIQGRFRNARVPSTVIGAGVDPAPPAEPERFRARHGLDGPFLLYVGRVDVLKGCRELVEAFLAWREATAQPVRLVFMGTIAMKLPRHPGLLTLGFRPAEEKWDAMAAATALVVPSPHESLSFVALEAWSLGTPVLASSRSPVLAGHLGRSGGGLLYDGAGEFGRQASHLLQDEGLRKRSGERGRAYVEARFRWPVLIERYRGFVEEVLGDGR